MGLSQTAWVLIAFILFFVLVGKKLWSALTTNLDQRKKMIENELNEAKKLREEAQAELNASLKKQKEINKQVLDIINDAKSTAKQIEADALKKSDIIIKRKEEQAKQKINNAQVEALNNIKNISAELSVKSAKVYIQNELDSKIQKALYSDSKQKLKEKL
jgi:F-type H+-transporting ATPase subunit b|tara:strand:- start:1634 stop:2113 length:480 start_codon:yes stop_codon:yes gene_type:complete